MHSDWLAIDPALETERICGMLREAALVFKRRGFVLGVSGGIDSSVTLALCVKAVGEQRVVALQMPERHSDTDTLRLSASVADHFKVAKVLEDISPILESVHCYARFDAAVRTVVPEYGEGWKSKIVMPNVIENRGYTTFSIVAQAPDGTLIKKRLPLDAYLGILSATNFKQRVRKMLEYYHADRLNYLVAGTPNRLEYDQGFFVKTGDGAADVKPIAHLYKTQVYRLAEYLGVPEEIRQRPPTTDTYSLPQGQDEFYFSLPLEKFDLCLYGKNHGRSPAEAAQEVGLTGAQVATVYRDIDAKRAATKYLHARPLMAGEVPELLPG
jgi:NAD+ synthase